MQIPTVLAAADCVGVGTFAFRAAVSAERGSFDLTATVLLATVAGVGGGTVRDLLLDLRVFWISDQTDLLVCAIAACVAWSTGGAGRHATLLEVADAIGLGAYAALGALRATAVHTPPAAAVAVGVIASTWGGMTREVLGGGTTVLRRRGVYVSAALLASTSTVLLVALGCPDLWATLLSAALGTAARATAVVLGLRMPGPPRRDGRRRARTTSRGTLRRGPPPPGDPAPNNKRR